jgi:hypothetical protein
MSERERLREIIRAAVAEAHPIEDARRPLELIVETSVRLAGSDGETLEIIDEQGQLRNGITLQDVIGELRIKHPTLFQIETKPETRPADDGPPSPETESQPSDAVPVTAAAPEVRPAGQPMPRDWLIIGETAPAPGWYDDGVELDPDASRTGIGRRLGRAGSALANRLRRAPVDVEQSPGERVSEPFLELPRRLTRRTALIATAGALALLMAAVGIYSVAVRPAGTPTAAPSQIAEAPVRQPSSPGQEAATSGPARSDAVPLQPAPAETAGADTANTSTGDAPPGGSSPAGSEGTVGIAGTAGRSATEAKADAGPPGGTDSSVSGAVPVGPNPASPSPESAPRTPLRGVPEVLDTATLWLGGQIVHLYGVEWVRGAGDPDDFTRYLKGREVACDPVEKVDAYRCTVEGHDLSEVVLFNGGAKSTPNAPPELRAAEEKARVAKIGVWSR